MHGTECVRLRNNVVVISADRSCTNSEGIDGVFLDATNDTPVCVDYAFSSSRCYPHDLGVDPNCVASSDGNATLPEYCNRSWCYVNRTQCRATEERVYRSQMFPAESGVDMVSSSVHILYLVHITCSSYFMSVVN